MHWYKIFNKDIGGDDILDVLLTEYVNNKNDSDHPDVIYSLEMTHYGLKAYKKQINPSILTLGIPLPCRIVHETKKAIPVMETV